MLYLHNVVVDADKFYQFLESKLDQIKTDLLATKSHRTYVDVKLARAETNPDCVALKLLYTFQHRPYIHEETYTISIFRRIKTQSDSYQKLNQFGVDGVEFFTMQDLINERIIRTEDLVYVLLFDDENLDHGFSELSIKGIFTNFDQATRHIKDLADKRYSIIATYLNQLEDISI